MLSIFPINMIDMRHHLLASSVMECILLIDSIQIQAIA